MRVSRSRAHPTKRSRDHRSHWRAAPVSHPGDTLPVLGSILRTSSASDALAMLGRLLDNLPIGFYVTDCTDEFVTLYANRVWQSWLTPAEVPIVGRRLKDVLAGAGDSGLVDLMRAVRLTAQPGHLRGFDFVGLSGARSSFPGGATRMDWEVYPLAHRPRQVTHLLSVVIAGPVHADRPSPIKSEAELDRLREEAEGVLRIFGVAPPRHPARASQELTERERDVSDLVARGLTNRSIADRLHLSTTTVSSHVAHILAKQHFRSRSQIATWVVERKMREFLET